MANSPSAFLSKTTFLYGCQCTKRLWLHKHLPEAVTESSEAQEALFTAGHDVGNLAQQLFPEGVLACEDRYNNRAAAISKTQQLMENGCTAIFEAAIQFNGVLVFVDLLTREGNKWIIWEVKSTTSVKEVHHMDVAIQYYVLSNAGIAIKDVRLLFINNEYVRWGDLDIEALFRYQSLMGICRNTQPEIRKNLKAFRELLSRPEAPDIEMGPQCTKPYECDYIEYCSQDLEEEPVDHGEAQFNPDALQEFIDRLEYPLYFLDFETWQSAIPEQDGHWPYRQIPFQFSLHIQKKPGTAVKHVAYLAENTASPLEDFALALLKACGNTGPIVVYNKAFESTRLRELADDYENYADAIQQLRNRMIDLMEPFRRRHYYLPEMQGSYSIKKVLPALVPELSYDELTIGRGDVASREFYMLPHYPPKQQQAIRNALLEYCKLDTWAMVRLLDELTAKLNSHD